MTYIIAVVFLIAVMMVLAFFAFVQGREVSPGEMTRADLSDGRPEHPFAVVTKKDGLLNWDVLVYTKPARAQFGYTEAHYGYRYIGTRAGAKRFADTKVKGTLPIENNPYKFIVTLDKR